MNKGCEFRFKKMSFKQSLPIHIRFQVYQLAKLRVLQFYYDSIDYSIDKSDYQYCMMDTDSAYIAISDESLEVIKPSLKDEFKKNRHLWLGRDDTIENKVYDSRTPGLFKLEYEGNCIISLASKMYYCDENKFSSKGINKKQNEITKQKYVDALKGKHFVEDMSQNIVSIYKVISGNGYSYFIADDDGNILPKAYKYYELQRIESTQRFHTESRQREPRMTNKERRNKRELEELGRIRGPAHKNGEH
ncbi:hypothetical protein BATDEDRAFT_22601 [Batrachochytrium dendrobatidis JAM81]|uniref:DNA-directed DNA polymerase n=1 Tax=Batrachochytrium dendrobatidis (strain JAM81 / FGSC 10211) TaxID=684364 RepID=F4NVG1_BATDJ|nr:uncharacterized protein BATDEDRAFT_22601 [Batrachochytrium dendrobatidis JAM81]EGF83699.1 hypothetical protein BATDEDRAFT_22601 [Batrachochytrium dendrobatidis JAM81]|eukprot:XP_006675608.1 hypothetical protein BATDEDRAFT_22601 [Batrachochytrium dendrobatidis JAM81]